jgi:hypothetical protein
MDLATVSLTALRARIRAYLLRQDQSPVLFIVPNSSRQQAIARVAVEEAAKFQGNPTSVWITTKEQITPEAVLFAPWVVAGHHTPVTLNGLTEPLRKEQAVVFADQGGQRV